MASQLKTVVGQVPEGHPLYREGRAWGAGCTCGWSSAGWPTRKQAKLREEAHVEEHQSGTLMPDIREVEALTPEVFPARAPEVATPTGVYAALKEK